MSSEDDVSNGGAACLAGISGPENGGNFWVVLGEGDVQRAAAHEHKNNRAFGGIRYLGDEFLLAAGKKEVHSVSHLGFLRLVQAHHQDRRVGFSGGGDRRVDRLVPSACHVIASRLMHGPHVLPDSFLGRRVQARQP